MVSENPKSILIAGESGSGKTTSLMNMADREDILYLNCEVGKPIPFKNKFQRRTITDPEDVIHYLEEIERKGDKNPFKIIVIDSISFLMDMWETSYVLNASNTQAAWGGYSQFFRRLMEQTAKTDCFFVFLGHLDTYLDEQEGMNKSKVPVKGALAKKGLEAFFTTVIYCRKLPVKLIQKAGSESSLLNISERDEELGFKHVFQTDTDVSTIGGRIRSPIAMWNRKELHIDNNVESVIEKLKKYYN